ncbi:MAG: stage III sporulation protein AD [Defluviitaleaceae bacterium]|nr:stage III sporulation protein AD [Defluviitaleaceae bacterium]
MDTLILRIAATGVVSAFLALSLKKDNPVFASLIAVIGGVLIFFMIAPYFSAVLSLFTSISDNIGTGGVYITTVLRVIGVAYAAEFGSSICADAGENGLAQKVELAGKILILAIAAPVILTLLQQILTVF